MHPMSESQIDEACAWLDEARDAEARGALVEAAELAVQAVRVFDQDDECAGDLANALVVLISIRTAQGALDEAELLAGRALDLARSFDGIDDELVVRIRVQALGAAACVARERARYDAAESL